MWQNMMLACYQVGLYLVDPIIRMPSYGVNINCKIIQEYYQHLFF